MYCKSKQEQANIVWDEVLIVAKCIVNFNLIFPKLLPFNVLIVAKCIVNIKNGDDILINTGSINSSKVYCKFI